MPSCNSQISEYKPVTWSSNLSVAYRHVLFEEGALQL